MAKSESNLDTHFKTGTRHRADHIFSFLSLTPQGMVGVARPKIGPRTPFCPPPFFEHKCKRTCLVFVVISTSELAVKYGSTTA